MKNLGVIRILSLGRNADKRDADYVILLNEELLNHIKQKYELNDVKIIFKHYFDSFGGKISLRFNKILLKSKYFTDIRCGYWSYLECFGKVFINSIIIYIDLAISYNRVKFSRIILINEEEININKFKENLAFILGHEIGHYLLHRQYTKGQFRFQTEKWADDFALGFQSEFQNLFEIQKELKI